MARLKGTLKVLVCWSASYLFATVQRSGKVQRVFCPNVAFAADKNHRRKPLFLCHGVGLAIGADLFI